MKKLLTLLFLLCTFLQAGAFIYTDSRHNLVWTFTLDGESATITGCTTTTGNVVSGNVIIPTKVKIDGRYNEYTVIEISSGVFSGNTGLTGVHIPSGVTRIGLGAFEGCTALTVVSINSNAFISRNYSSSSSISQIFGDQVTTYAIGEGVTSIGECAFYGCQNMTSVTIPSTVTSIGWLAFEGCTALTVVSINSNALMSSNYSTTSTLSQIFGDEVTTYTIGEGVTSIGECAFYHCQNMTSVTIPSTVTSIGKDAFSYCWGLTTLTIPEGVTNIGPSAFYACGNLTNVNIPSSVTEIGGWAFYGCSVLTKVIVPDIAAWCNISFSSSYANPLMYAHHLYSDANTEYTDVVIPEGVSKIGSYAFSGDAGLTSITIPSNVTSIGKDAFSYCWGLTTLTIPEGVTSIGSCAFWGCTGLTSINIPVGVTTISKELFHGCTSLSRVTIPEGVTSIGEDAFSNCNLSSIIIPSSVTEIGGWAFYKCPLTSVACYRPTPISANSNNFTCYDTATLYVPSGSVEAYQGENPWYNFQNIRAIPDPADVNGDGEVDVADFTLTANYLLGKSPNGFIVIVADVAGAAGGTPDGEIDIADLTGIANIILHSGSAQNTGE